MRPWTNKSLSLAVIGLLLVAIGTSLCFLSPTIFHYILQKGLALSPTSESFDIWKDTSNLPPMRMNIYFFNWTNPEELTRGKKPHLVQVGPYCFREVRQKINLTFHPENKTVSYFQRRLWYFDAEHSNGSLSDTISHLNIVAASAAHKIRDWDYGLQKSLSFLLSASRIYVIKTVDELLFTGYSDKLLTMGKMMASETEMPPYDRFGWFYMRNGTTELDGHMNMETGEEDISQLGVLRKWNYRDTVKYYKSPCSVIEGSAGEFWPPGRTKDQITLFSVDLCRSLIYEYEETIYHKGIEAYRYALDKKTFGNATKRRYPHEQAKFFEPTTTTEDFFASEHSGEVAGFSTKSISTSSAERSSEEMDEYSNDDPDVVNIGHCYCNGECTPSGLINTTACRFGAPIFISLPHFYKTDPSVLEQVEGLNPSDKYSFDIALEPRTGIPLEVSAKLQVNFLLQPSQYVSLFKDVPKIYFPVLWFSLRVEVTDEMASSLKRLLAVPTVVLSIGVITAIIGLCLIGVVALLHLLKKQHIPPTDAAEKTISQPSEKKSEMMYMDKITANEDSNVRSDRRLYAKPY